MSNRRAIMRGVESRGLYVTRYASPIATRQRLGCYSCRPGAANAGLGALGLNYQGAASGAAQGASVGSVVPVIGTTVGAVVGAIAGAFMKKKDPNAAEKAALKGQLDDYQKVMGQVPGRAFTLTTLRQLIDGAGQKGMWPNVKKWSGDAIGGAIDGCKGCTPPTIPTWVQQQVQAGIIDPRQLADLWTQHVNQTWGSKWMIATAGPVQRQLITDLMDYYIALYKPDAPLFYAPTWTAGAQTSSAPTSGNAGTVVPIVPTPAPTPIFATPRPTPTPSPPAVSSATDPNLQAYIQALMQQGLSQQQAFNAAMQALQNSGVQATPQVQQQVASDVASASQAGGVTGLPSWVLYGAAGLALVLALARPRGRKT